MRMVSSVGTGGATWHGRRTRPDSTAWTIVRGPGWEKCSELRAMCKLNGGSLVRRLFRVKQKTILMFSNYNNPFLRTNMCTEKYTSLRTNAHTRTYTHMITQTDKITHTFLILLPPPFSLYCPLSFRPAAPSSYEFLGWDSSFQQGFPWLRTGNKVREICTNYVTKLICPPSRGGLWGKVHACLACVCAYVCVFACGLYECTSLILP